MIIKYAPKKWGHFLQGIIMFYWLTVLVQTDSYYSVYLFMGIGGIISFIENTKYDSENPKNRMDYFVVFIVSVVFGLAVSLANYKIFIELYFPDDNDLLQKLGLIYRTLVFIAVSCGGG